MITLMDLGILGWIHYDSMISGTATDAMSFTGTLMIMAVKVSMFGYHMSDGNKIRKCPETPLSVMPNIDAQRRSTAVLVPPSFFEYMAYQFDFMGGLVGPIFTYREYMEFINREGDFLKIETISTRRRLVKSTARAFAILGTYMYLQTYPIFRKGAVIEPHILGGLPFHYRLIVFPIVIAISRFVYYTVWALTEVTCVISGIAFVPPYHFTRARNVNLRAVESCVNTNQMTSNWNIRISDTWLKQCIYQRVERVPRYIAFLIPSRKGAANLLTKLTSAFWHGWYPGYAISFLSLGMMSWTESVVRSRLHPLLPEWFLKSRIATLMAWIHTWTSVNVFFGPFILLTWEKVHLFNNSIYYVFHIYHLILIFGLPLFFERAPRGRSGTPKQSTTPKRELSSVAVGRETKKE
jgi:lysophospholipid acyltransferase